METTSTRRACGERQRHQIGIRRGGIANGDVDRLPVDVRQAVRDLQSQADARVGRQNSLNHGSSTLRPRSDGISTPAGCPGPAFRPQRICSPTDASRSTAWRAFQEELALGRDALPAGRAHQQRRAELGFQAGGGRRLAGWGQAQLASGRGQAARLDGGDEQLQGRTKFSYSNYV